MTGADATEDVGPEVVDAAMAMYEAGLVVGTAGNVSGRDAEGRIHLTPSSVPYPEITVDLLAVLDSEGDQVGGEGSPSTEKDMHLACFREFPEVGGVLHCHAPHASMFAIAHQPVPAVIEEAVVYVGGEIPVAAYQRTGSVELAEELVGHLADRGAVLMANHGMLCVGRSPADALHTAQVVEHMARVVLGARQIGGEVPLRPAVVDEFAGIYSFIRQETWLT
jgi:L-fuculose-phosphate aldolase